MKRNVICLVSLIGLVGLSGTSLAQQMKPGLWEVNNKMKMDPAMEAQMEQMRKQMAAMSPEQRKQMEAAMGKSGVKMDMGAGGGMVIKMCLTKEDVERNTPPTGMQSDCKSDMTKSGNTMKMKFSCPNPPSSGEATYTYASNESYAMKMTITSSAGGAAKTTEMSGNGRWLGADCQGIKPIIPQTGKK
jgi:hypothetical protein